MILNLVYQIGIFWLKSLLFIWVCKVQFILHARGAPEYCCLWKILNQSDFDFASTKCASIVLMKVYNANSLELYTLALSSLRFAAGSRSAKLELIEIAIVRFILAAAAQRNSVKVAWSGNEKRVCIASINIFYAFSLCVTASRCKAGARR